MRNAEQQRAFRIEHALDVPGKLIDIQRQVTQLITAYVLDAVAEIAFAEMMMFSIFWYSWRRAAFKLVSFRSPSPPGRVTGWKCRLSSLTRI